MRFSKAIYSEVLVVGRGWNLALFREGWEIFLHACLHLFPLASCDKDFWNGVKEKLLWLTDFNFGRKTFLFFFHTLTKSLTCHRNSS